MDIRVRIAPSPTGDPHVGTLYIALFNLIFVRHYNGKFILRIEDTDRSRSRPEYERNIYNALSWAQISWDEGPDIGGPYGPYRQSERNHIYRKYAEDLIKADGAYKCFATAEELEEMREIAKKSGQRLGYDRRYRNLTDEEIRTRIDEGQSYVIRLKVPLKGECEFEDGIKGRITVPWADIDDQILLKSDGQPTYHLANVVDDYLMKITHVIRGDEWISSTPKHILLYQLFGWSFPTFMHMPLLLGKDGKKLSKRKNPTSVFYYRDSGYLPEALVNFLSLMGYSMGEDREVYTLDEIIKHFDYKRIGVSGAFFDIKKLDWINQKYLIDSITEDQLWSRIVEWSFNDDFMKKLMPLIHTRIKTFGDFIELCSFFFVNDLHYQTDLFSPKNLPFEHTALLLQTIIWSLEEQEDWGSAALEKASHEVAEAFQVHHKKVMIPILFAAIMGKSKGPPLFTSAEILGRYRTRARFLQSIEFVGGVSNKKMDKLKRAWNTKDCSGLIS